MASVLPLIESAKVRALAVTSLKRVSMLPSVPTLDESALPGYEYAAWYGITAPAAVPRAIVVRLNNAIAKIVQMPDVKEAFVKQGMEPQASTPEQFAATIAREIELTAKLLQVAGVKPE